MDSVRAEVDVRPLEGIANITDRLNTATDSLYGFVQRFQGRPPTASANEELKTRPDSYSDSLTRLWQAIERLDEQVEAINRIG